MTIKQNGQKEHRNSQIGYYSHKYDGLGRFCSYWHQINEIITLDPENVLEIGIGNGLVCKYLKERDVNITTLDIKENVKPDVVGTVLDMPFKDNCFDVVACYEVLEHLPYDQFCTALSEIRRVAKSYVILSIPDARKVLGVTVDSVVSRYHEIIIPLLGVRKKDKYHKWEIGRKGYSLRKILRSIEKAKFEVKKHYRARGNPYHRFFVLKKPDK